LEFQIPREFDLTAVKGHPRSSILVSMESTSEFCDIFRVSEATTAKRMKIDPYIVSDGIVAH